MIYPESHLDFNGFFQWKHLIQVLAIKMQDFLNPILHNCIVILNAEQVNWKHQLTNIKNKEVKTLNPKSFQKIGFSKS